ncbi:YciI family protein [Iodobacter sp. LRB]|uniref:YciI family protein n=1 Tax=unclassified Iodobacter TaxID=235634 RepID=UPI000C121D94|nr:YciI family protein [Iodobacter sp. BJB302]PHV01026.1 hypothetical protein CSQ88_14110 [Iodobacter sp. BJB302]
MAMYCLSIHHPSGYNPSVSEDPAMGLAIDALDGEMVAAGVRVFVGGLHPAEHAKSIRMQANGQLQVSEGPYLNTTEHVGGFWVLQVANLEEAMAWGRKAAVACRAPVEVRQFH